MVICDTPTSSSTILEDEKIKEENENKKSNNSITKPSCVKNLTSLFASDSEDIDPYGYVSTPSTNNTELSDEVFLPSAEHVEFAEESKPEKQCKEELASTSTAFMKTENTSCCTSTSAANDTDEDLFDSPPNSQKYQLPWHKNRNDSLYTDEASPSADACKYSCTHSYNNSYCKCA